MDKWKIIAICEFIVIICLVIVIIYLAIKVASIKTEKFTLYTSLDQDLIELNSLTSTGVDFNNFVNKLLSKYYKCEDIGKIRNIIIDKINRINPKDLKQMFNRWFYVSILSRIDEFSKNCYTSTNPLRGTNLQNLLRRNKSGFFVAENYVNLLQTITRELDDTDTLRKILETAEKDYRGPVSNNVTNEFKNAISDLRDKINKLTNAKYDNAIRYNGTYDNATQDNGTWGTYDNGTWYKESGGGAWGIVQ